MARQTLENQASGRSRVKRNAMLGGMVILASLLFAGEALAQGGPGSGRRGGPGHGPGHGRMGRLVRHLDLTPEQRQQIQTLRQEMREELQDTHERIRELRQQIRAEWDSGQPDEATLLTLHRELNTLQQVVQERHIRFRLAVHSILTPEQREELSELREQRRAHGRHGRRGRRGGQQ